MRRPKQDLLPEMNDKQLESQTTGEIWLCELTPVKHWAEGALHRASGEDGCEERDKLEIFKRVKQRLLTKISWGKTPMIE